jgi:hypothetical protein
MDMKNKIIFTNVLGIQELSPPEPAYKNIPDWYKNMESYVGGEKIPNGQGSTTGSIKKCMPVFDAIASGYIIKTPVDVYVSQKKSEKIDQEHFEKTGETILLDEEKMKENNFPLTMPYYEWANFGIIQFHPIEQAPDHPNRNGHQLSYPKWVNPWGIKTPPGYSSIFVQPWHRYSPFTIFPGVVDTDTYSAPVNFPFVLNDVTWQGLIPAGTPIAQVIPFKRQEWEMEFGGEQDVDNSYKISKKLRSKFFDSYKSQFRQPKEYR